EIDKAKSEFFAQAAHQLRAPLSSMHWNIELLLSDKTGKALSSSMKKKLKDIYENNQQLIDLVKNLLDVSRIEQGVLPNEPEEVDTVAVTQNVIDDMKAIIKKKSLTVHLEKETHLKKITIDPQRFREIVSNLLS